MLHIENLRITFPQHKRRLHVVRDFSLSVGTRDRVALLGESGSGKSLVLLAIMRLLPERAEQEGRIFFHGQDIAAMPPKELQEFRRHRLSYIPQGAGNSLNPLHTIGRQVTEGMDPGEGAAAAQILTPFGFAHPDKLVHAYPHMLSGGMKQRVLVAMGLVRDAVLTLADEPTKGLDPRHCALVLDAFQQATDRAFLCVTHDLHFARAFADRIAVMYAATLLECSPKEAFFKEPLHPYAQALLAALPENGLRNLSGFAPPHTQEQGDGCVFYERCPGRFSPCRREPPLFPWEGGRKVRCWHYAAGSEENYGSL